MCKIKHIETNADKAHQISKCAEEHNEWLDDNHSPEESCDVIRSHMTYLENHCGGFDKHWKKHLEKMEERNWTTREDYDAERRMENSNTVTGKRQGKPKGNS